MSFTVRGASPGLAAGHPGPLSVTSPGGVEVLAMRSTGDALTVVVWPAPGRGRSHVDVVLEAPSGARAVVRLETVPMPVLERWAAFQLRPALELQDGPRAGAGVALDAGFSWPFPLGIHPFRLGLRTSATLGGQATAPFAQVLAPGRAGSTAWSVPAMGYLGLDAGWHSLRVHADAGAGVTSMHAFRADATAPWSPRSERSEQGGGACLLGARVGGAAHVGVLRLGAELQVTGGWWMGPGARGPAGAVMPAVFVGGLL